MAKQAEAPNFPTSERKTWRIISSSCPARRPAPIQAIPDIN
jgi:hypothetical protein